MITYTAIENAIDNAIANPTAFVTNTTPVATVNGHLAALSVSLAGLDIFQQNTAAANIIAALNFFGVVDPTGKTNKELFDTYTVAFKALGNTSEDTIDALRITLGTFGTTRAEMLAQINSLYGTAVDSNESLQRQVEVRYVQKANELLYEKLYPLQQYLQQTQDALDILADIQNMRNTGVAVKPRTPYVPFANTTIDNVLNDLNASFNTPIYTSVTFKYTNASGTLVADAAGFVQKLYGLRARLSAIIPVIQANTPAAQLNDPNNILNLIKGIKNTMPDISTLNAGNNFAFSVDLWLNDGYREGGFNNVGGLPQGGVTASINKAITAAENLNTSQVAEVRTYLLNFEEFYKSAATILQAITQIINRMAQGISR